MIIKYKNHEIEILKTGDVQIDKDFVEIWLDGNQIANIEKVDQELKIEFYNDKEKVYDLPVDSLKRAIEMAEGFIED